MLEVLLCDRGIESERLLAVEAAESEEDEDDDDDEALPAFACCASASSCADRSPREIVPGARFSSDEGTIAVSDTEIAAWA